APRETPRRRQRRATPPTTRMAGPGTDAPAGRAPSARPPPRRSSAPPGTLGARLESAHVVDQVPAVAAAHLVSIDRHQPAPHHLAAHDDRVDVAVGPTGDRVVHERTHAEERATRRRRNRAVTTARRTVAD